MHNLHSWTARDQADFVYVHMRTATLAFKRHVNAAIRADRQTQIGTGQRVHGRMQSKHVSTQETH
jgi:hypothetical protein